MLRMLVMFFAGVLATLFFLVPGKNGPTILVNGDSNRQVAEISAAGEKIEKVGESALSWTFKAKDFVWENIQKEEG
jgi:hypothetical protein